MADIVCVHGLAGSPRWWRPVLSQLEERYDVELLDMRDVAPAEGAEWLAAHMSPETTVIAHSLGGLLAAQLAARRPLRKLVLVAPAGVPTGRHPVLEFFALAATIFTVRPLFLLTIALDALRWGPLALIRGGRYAISSDLRHDLEHITVPTLVVWGESDRLVPTRLAQTWVDSIPDARLELIPGSAHVPMVENPSAFVGAVLDFLEEPVVRTLASADGGAERPLDRDRDRSL
jgi:pimeloyl-ACP methyl ester carboxylesterase